MHVREVTDGKRKFWTIVNTTRSWTEVTDEKIQSTYKQILEENIFGVKK